MALVPRPKIGDEKSIRQAIQKLGIKVGPTSTPTFKTIVLSDLTPSRLLATDVNKNLVSSDLVNWVTGTTNQITVTDDSDGTITLSTPQDIHTGASPTFDDLTISTPSNIYSLSHDSFADFASDEHVAHTGVSITAGNGLTGGGDISSTRTLSFDTSYSPTFAGLTVSTAVDKAAEAIQIDQNDEDEAFIDFAGTSAADSSKNISTQNGDGSVEGPKNYSSANGWAFAGMVKVEVNGTAYWMPYYSEDTA